MGWKGLHDCESPYISKFLDEFSLCILSYNPEMQNYIRCLRDFLLFIPHVNHKVNFPFFIFHFQLKLLCSLTSVLYKLVSMQFIFYQLVNSCSLSRVSLSDHSTGRSGMPHQFFLVT